MNAPAARRIDALTGARAPEVFFRSLSEADEFCRENAAVERLRIENQQLRDSVNEIGCLLQTTQQALAAARAERDAWRAKAQGRRVS